MDDEKKIRVFREQWRLHLSSRLQVSEAAQDLIERHFRLLIKWNRVHNLTSVDEVESLVSEHYIDCLWALSVWQAGTKIETPIYDLGSGNGFPGVIGAILFPEYKFVLIESSRKKCSFLRMVSADLSLLNLSILQKRVEELSELEIAITRAAFSEPKINELADAFKQNGSLALMTVPSFPSERWNLSESPWSISSRSAYFLPSGAERCVVVLRKK